MCATRGSPSESWNLHVEARTVAKDRVQACELFRSAGCVHKLMRGHWGVIDVPCLMDKVSLDSVTGEDDSVAGEDDSSAEAEVSTAAEVRSAVLAAGRAVWARLAPPQTLLLYLDTPTNTTSNIVVMITGCTAVCRLFGVPPMPLHKVKVVDTYTKWR